MGRPLSGLAAAIRLGLAAAEQLRRPPSRASRGSACGLKVRLHCPTKRIALEGVPDYCFVRDAQLTECKFSPINRSGSGLSA